jgi:hypothetical protein
MAERQDDIRTPGHYDETNDPKNPPNSMIQERTVSRAFWSYVGPVLVLSVVAAVGMVYWLSRGPTQPTDRNERESSSVGTAGERSPGENESGGFNPTPRPHNTRDELEFRGTAAKPSVGNNEELTLKGVDDVTRVSASTHPRRVELRDVEVESVDGKTFWAQQGRARVAVVAPADAPSLRAGMHVNVSGQTEDDGHGGARVRATNLEVRD